MSDVNTPKVPDGDNALVPAATGAAGNDSPGRPVAQVDESWIGVPVGHRRSALSAPAGQLPDHAARLLAAGYRLALVAGHDDLTTPAFSNDLDLHGRVDGPPPAAGETSHRLRVVYLFTRANPDQRVELHVALPEAAPRVPSLAAQSFPAGRFERELHDLFGVVPENHPLPRRLVRHFHWPQGWYPMLADAGPAPEFAAQDGPYPFRSVDGPGVYEIPVGPVHAGMIEPGHFRFSVVGETILNMKARLWFVHRGLERLFQQRPPEAGIELAERISGDTAIGHTLAYCRAVEDAWGIACDDTTDQLRAVLLELERIYNHVTDLGALCNDVGHSVLNAHAARIRERLMRINAAVTGHRLLRGALYPGGATVQDLPPAGALTEIAEDVTEIAALALNHSVVHDRFDGTAVLHPEQAHDLGVLGYVARASGLAIDARHDHPTPATEALPRAVHRHTGGDVLARFCVRVEEITASITQLQALLAALDGRRHGSPTPSPDRRDASRSSGVGIAEGWRGTIVHRIETAGYGRLSRVKVVDPSFFNWPALPLALADTIVPDFPLTNKSFNLSYAGNDL